MIRERFVLDTNVLVCALRSRRGPSFHLLSLIGTGRFDICVSVPLLFEYEDVLARETIGVSQEAARDVLDYICQVGVHQEVYYLWRPILRDPKDDHILELAVASQSEGVVTYNLKDFSEGKRFGLQILKPADLLNRIGET